MHGAVCVSVCVLLPVFAQVGEGILGVNETLEAPVIPPSIVLSIPMDLACQCSALVQDQAKCSS